MCFRYEDRRQVIDTHGAVTSRASGDGFDQTGTQRNGSRFSGGGSSSSVAAGRRGSPGQHGHSHRGAGGAGDGAGPGHGGRGAAVWGTAAQQTGATPSGGGVRRDTGGVQDRYATDTSKTYCTYTYMCIHHKKKQVSSTVECVPPTYQPFVRALIATRCQHEEGPLN